MPCGQGSCTDELRGTRGRGNSSACLRPPRGYTHREPRSSFHAASLAGEVKPGGRVGSGGGEGFSGCTAALAPRTWNYLTVLGTRCGLCWPSWGLGGGSSRTPFQSSLLPSTVSSGSSGLRKQTRFPPGSGALPPDCKHPTSTPRETLTIKGLICLSPTGIIRSHILNFRLPSDIQGEWRCSIWGAKNSCFKECLSGDTTPGGLQMGEAAGETGERGCQLTGSQRKGGPGDRVRG